MKTPRTNRFLAILRRFLTLPAFGISFFLNAHAADNTWTGATNNDWDTTTANWSAPTTWSNGNSAIIPSGSGAIQLNDDITLTGLTINGPSDSINITSGNTLLLNYATAAPTVTGGWGNKITGPGTIRLNSAQPVNGTANWGPNTSAATPFLPAFTGTLIVDNGRIDSSATGLGGITGITLNNGSQFLAWTGTYSQPFTLTGDGWGEAGQPGALRAAGGQNATFNGQITLAGNASLSAQDINSIVTLNNAVSGTGNLTLHTRGKFNFNGSTSESYVGNLNIITAGSSSALSTITLNKTSGAIAVPNDTRINFGTPGGTGEVNLRMAIGANGQFGSGVHMNFLNPAGQWSRFDLIGTNQTLAGISTGNFNTQGAGVVQNREINGLANYGTATLTLNGNTSDANYPVGGYMFNGHLRDADSGVNALNLLNLIKNGTGTQTLVGNVVNYSGSTVVNAGTLTFAKTNGLNTSIQNNATVEIHSAAGDDWILNSGKTLSGAGTWNKTGPGRASLRSTTVTTTGHFNILEGTIRNDFNFGNWSASTASVAISSGATLDLFADAIQVSSLTGSGIVQNGFGNNGGQSGAALFIEKFTVGISDASSTFAGTIRNNSGNNLPNNGTTNGGGGLELHKVGTGTLTLTGTLSYTGLTNINAGTLAIASASNNTLAGPVNGSGNLVKSGNGTLTLGGTNTLTGPTTINGGALIVSGTAPNTAVTVNDTGTFGASTTGKTFASIDMANGSALSLPAVTAQTTNATSLNLISTPDITVLPTFPGAPAVGTYDLLTPASITGTVGTITTDFGIYDAARGVAGTTALSGGKIVLTVSSTFSGAANLVWDNADGLGTGIWKAKSPTDDNFDNAGADDQFFDLDNVAFNGAAPGTITLVDTVAPASITVNNSSGDYTFAGSGSIIGPATLVKSGTSALTIATSNSFTGAVTLNGGTLNANAVSALGSGTVTLNAGAINANAASALGTGPANLGSGTLTLGAPAALAPTQAITFPTGSDSIIRLNGNPVTVAGINNQFPFINTAHIESGSATPGTDVLTVNNATDNLFTGVLRDGGVRSLGLTKSAAGTLTFTGSSSNTHTGPTTLSAGRIGLSKTGGAVAITGDFIGDNLNSPDVFTTENNQFSPTSAMHFIGADGDHVRFELLGTTQTLAGIDNSTAAGRGVIQQREQVIPTSITGTSTLNLEVPESESFFFNGYLRDTGGIMALVKNGLGTQTLGGPNITHTGGTIINEGTLAFSSRNVARGALTINNGGTLDLTGENATDSISSITINAGGTMTDSFAAHNVQLLNLNGGTISATSTPLFSYGNFVLGNTVTVGGTQTSVIACDVRVAGNQNRNFVVNPTGDPSGIDLDITGRIGHLNNVAWSYMTKTGTGTLRLNNPAVPNDIGSLTVTEGKVVLNNQLPTLGNGGLVNNATVEAITAEETNLALVSAMSGTTGNLIKSGLGTLTLSSTANTYSGSLQVSEGLLNIPTRGASGALPYANVSVDGGAALRITSPTGVFRSTGLTLSNTSNLLVSNFVADPLQPPIDVTTTNPVLNGNINVEISGISTAGTSPFMFYPVSGSPAGDGVAALSLNSNRSIDAEFVDNSANSSIDLQVNEVNPVTWVGNESAAWNTDPGTENWTLESTATAYQEDDLVLFDDTASVFSVTLDETVNPYGILFANNTEEYQISGTGAISGTAQLIKNGNANSIITGTHTYTGGTVINEGSLQLGDGTSNGTISGAITVNSGLILNNATPQTLSNTITGAGTVTKTGTGVFTVGAGQNYPCSTIVDGGTFRLFNAPSFGSPVTVNDTGILNLDGTGTVFTPAGLLVTLNDGATVNYSNTNATGSAWAVMNGGFTQSGNTTINITASSPANNSGLFLDAGLHGTGTLTINATTPGIGVNFRNNNATFAGNIVVNGISSTTAGAGSGIGVGGCTTALQNANITVNGTMELLNRGIGWANAASGQFWMGALNGTGTMIANFTSGGVTTVTLGHTNVDGSFSGQIHNGTGNIVNLIKLGDGTQTLAGPSTYTGYTNVNAGTLMTNNSTGSATGTGTVTVAADATLAGTGTVTGTVSIALGGFISPGATGTESLATGPVTLAGIYLCEIDDDQSDRIDVTGAINATGGTIAFSEISAPTAAEYVIATYTLAPVGDLPTFTNIPEGYEVNMDTPGQIKLVSTETGYDSWATLKGLDETNNATSFDADNDGYSNLIEFYLDGNPLASDNLVQADFSDEDYLILTFNRRDDAETDIATQSAQFGSDLNGWTTVALTADTSTDVPTGVIIEVIENDADPDAITVKIPRTHEVDGTLFGRIHITR
jgi:autotransporter-associated beta strand protein